MMIMKIRLPARMQEPKRCCYSSLVANDCTVSFFVSQSLSVMQTSTAVTSLKWAIKSQRLGSPPTPTPLQLLVHSPLLPLYNFWFTPHHHPSTTSGHSLPQQHNAATPQLGWGVNRHTAATPSNQLEEPTLGSGSIILSKFVKCSHFIPGFINGVLFILREQNSI